MFAKRKKRSSEKEIQYILEIITCDPSIYTMDHPAFIACRFMENSIGLKRVKHYEPDISTYKLSDQVSNSGLTLPLASVAIWH